MPAGLADLGLEPAGDDGDPWAIGGAGTPDAQAVNQMQRALELTGVTEAGRTMAKVLPALKPGVSIDAFQLTPFEGYLLSLVDGQSTVDDIMAMSGLTLFEAVTAFTSLYDKGVLELVERKPAMNDPRSIPPPPPVDPEPSGEGAALSKLALRRAAVKAPRRQAVETDPDVLIERAQAAVEQGDLDSAREYTRLALVYAPNSESALGMQRTLSDPDRAQLRAQVLHGIAVQAYQDADYGTAMQLLRAALEEFEPAAPVHHRLALALARADEDLELALQHLRRAIELEPENDRYRRNLDRLRRLQQASEGS